MGASEKVEVGRFSYDPATGEVTGPAEYMREAGKQRIALIEGGHDHVFNYGVSSGASPNAVVAMLVSLQTDYAGWRGHEDMKKRIGAGVTW